MKFGKHLGFLACAAGLLTGTMNTSNATPVPANRGEGPNAMRSPAKTSPPTVGQRITIRQSLNQADDLLAGLLPSEGTARSEFRKLNQRQIRKNARRAHAAGSRRAFA